MIKLVIMIDLLCFFLMQDLSRADFDNESWHSFFDKCIEKYKIHMLFIL